MNSSCPKCGIRRCDKVLGDSGWIAIYECGSRERMEGMPDFTQSERCRKDELEQQLAAVTADNAALMKFVDAVQDAVLSRDAKDATSNTVRALGASLLPTYRVTNRRPGAALLERVAKLEAFVQEVAEDQFDRASPGLREAAWELVKP